MYRTALDRAGPDQCDLDDQVIERAGFEPRQRRHLGAALDLEHTDRIRLTQHVVDAVFLRDPSKVDLDAVVVRDQINSQM